MTVSLDDAQAEATRAGLALTPLWLTRLRAGMEVELEHTNDLHIAAQIALDHLRERGDYYERLALVEGRLPPCDYGKGQWIRILDVFVVGPLMIWGGTALKPKSKVAGYGLMALGVGTIALNGYNWARFASSHGEYV